MNDAFYNSGFISVLLSHAARYPLMEPQDGVKLVYQSVFFGGHLLRDPEAARNYLHTEWSETPYRAGASLTESIGEGWVRFALCAFPYSPKAGDLLFAAFQRASRCPPLPVRTFYARLGVLKTVTGQGYMPFSPDALQSYLNAYLPDDPALLPPAVSHSPAYRLAYHPAYRVLAQNEVNAFLTEIGVSFHSAQI